MLILKGLSYNFKLSSFNRRYLRITKDEKGRGKRVAGKYYIVGDITFLHGMYVQDETDVTDTRAV